MKKNTRTLLITLISFVVVLAIAAVAYNGLRKNAPSVSFTPTLAAQAPKVEPEKTAPATPQVPALAADVEAEPALPPTDAQADQNQSREEDGESIMPNIPLTRLDGTVTSFDAVREGKPVIINYFASWCPPCKQELPHFQKAFDEYGQEISFIFLDALDGQRETLKTINAFIRDFPFTGPVYYDDGMFAALFQTNSLPTTVFIDSKGRVVKGYLGFVPEEVLYADIKQLLD